MPAARWLFIACFTYLLVLVEFYPFFSRVVLLRFYFLVLPPGETLNLLVFFQVLFYVLAILLHRVSQRAIRSGRVVKNI